MTEHEQEISRLRELVASLEKLHGVKSARVELTETGHLVITAPSMDEMQFGGFVAATMATYINAAGILTVATGEPTVTP